MAPSRGKLIDELTDDITRTALASAGLSAEDRVLAGQRVRQRIEASAMGAHRDVVAASRGDDGSPEAEPFSGYMDSDPRSRPQHAPDSPQRRLAAELLAADSRTNSMDPERTERAQEYIAHAVAFDAAAEAKKVPGGPSQAPAVAAGAVAVPVVAVKAGVDAIRARPSQDRRGPSIG
jgi:hypothetical protein